MMKFFRKYNKHLLALFMVLLMVVFIGGQALQAFLTPRTDVTVAESKLGPIKFLDQQIAQDRTRILQALGFNWQRPFGSVTEPIEIVDWILLTREAELLQMRMGPAAVLAWLGGELGREQIDLFARRLRVKTDRVLEAVGEFLAIQAAGRAVASTTVPSWAEVRSTARDILGKVRVSAVMLPAEAFAGTDTGFTEEEVNAQWSAHRDSEPGAGLDFGYYVPPKLEVQYIKIDRDAIARKIRIANEELKAKRFFKENRQSHPAFVRPPEESDSSATEGEDAAGLNDVADDAEGSVKEKSPYLEWEEAKEAAIEIIRGQHADEATASIANWLLQYDADRWLDTERGEDGYRNTPERVARLDYYQDLLEHLPATIAFPEAVRVVQTDSLSKDEAADAPEIGKTMYRPRSGVWQRFGDLAFRTKAIVPKVPDEQGTARSEYLAPFQSCPYVLTDPDGNAYVFRVVDFTPGHPAESVDEVRDRVVGDLQTLRGLDVAKARAEGLISCTPDVSLQEAFESDAELAGAQAAGLGVGFFELPAVSRMRLAEAGIDRTRTTTYVGGGIGDVPNEVIEQWFDLEDAWERTAVYELKDRAAIMVVEWVETQQPRDEQFEEEREEIVQRLSDRRRQQAIADWFDPEQIRARNGFELTR